MSIDNQQSTGVVAPQRPDSPVTAAQSHLTLPFDIRASAQALTMYLCNRGMLESVRATGSDESVWFGVGVGIFLAAGGVLAPLYISGYVAATGKLAAFLWAVLALSGVYSVHCWRRWKQQRDKSKAMFDQILAESTTVVSFPTDLKR